MLRLRATYMPPDSKADPSIHLRPLQSDLSRHAKSPPRHRVCGRAGSMTTCDRVSSRQKVMLRSGTAVERSQARCSVPIALWNMTVTGTPGARSGGSAKIPQCGA